METNTTYPIDLITRYLAGEAEGDDLVFLEKWLKANPDNQKVFNDYRKTWEVMEASRVAEQVDVDLAWEEFESERENYSDQPVSDFSFRLGGRRITLTPSRVLRYAAIFFLLSIPSIILFHYYTKPETKILQAGQALVESTLPDGSLVTLNAGSHLEYPAVFDHLKRGVQLRGEAYFEVTHNTGKPFVIYYNNARVEVLGTRFYVNTNAEDGKMEVVLKEGSVSVYFKNRPNESVTLTPGEKAEITPDQTAIRKRMNDDENYLAWKTHQLTFNNEELTQITAKLNKVYHSGIRISNPQLGKCRVTATFDNQSLESVLNVLKATLGFNVDTKGNVTEISGKNCE